LDISVIDQSPRDDDMSPTMSSMHIKPGTGEFFGGR
jgi:hypothetical protein